METTQQNTTATFNVANALNLLQFVPANIVGGDNSYFNKSLSAQYKSSWIACYKALKDNSLKNDKFVYTAHMSIDNKPYINRLSLALNSHIDLNEIKEFENMVDVAKRNKAARQEEYAASHYTDEEVVF